jgi:hypothetical protein
MYCRHTICLGFEKSQANVGWCIRERKRLKLIRMKDVLQGNEHEEKGTKLLGSETSDLIPNLSETSTDAPTPHQRVHSCAWRSNTQGILSDSDIKRLASIPGYSKG